MLFASMGDVGILLSLPGWSLQLPWIAVAVVVNCRIVACTGPRMEKPFSKSGGCEVDEEK